MSTRATTQRPECSSSAAAFIIDLNRDTVLDPSNPTSEVSQNAGRDEEATPSSAVSTMSQDTEQDEEAAPSPPTSVPQRSIQSFLAASGTRWQPFWLRRHILGCFSGLFLGSAVAFAVMAWYSRHYEGLCETSSELSYLWRFGPAAVLTLISILWSRVELQALRYMHWITIRTGKSLGPQGYKLDYSQMFFPMVLLRSLRLKHHFVFFIVAISVMLKLQIVLSAGLFQLTAVTLERQVDIQTVDTFSIISDPSNVTGNAAYFQAKSMQDYNMVLPFGLSKNFAYQTFQERGKVGSPITAVVDGLFASVTCLKLENWESEYIDSEEEGRIALYLHFEDCQDPITVKLEKNMDSFILFQGDFEEPMNLWKFDLNLEPPRPCSSLPQQHKQFLYIAISWVTKKTSNGTGILADIMIDSCGAVLCSPNAWLSQVEVTDDGISPVAVDLQHSLSEVNANIWDMMQIFIPGGIGSDVPGGFDTRAGPAIAVLEFQGKLWDIEDKALVQTDTLEQAVMNLTDILGPIIGHDLIRQKEDGHVYGTRIQQLDRLQVNEVVGLSMAALSGLSAIMGFWALLQSMWAPWLWHRDPATILGLLVLSISKGPLHEAFINAHSDSQASTKTQWSHGAYSPLILRSWIRIIFSLFTISIIAALSFGHITSNNHEGLVTISGPDSHLTLIWTSLPALVLLIITLYVNSTDLAIRSLATLSMLSAHDYGFSELDLSLLDMLGVQALYHSLRLKIFTVTVSQALATIAAFLTTLGAILFSPEQVPKTCSNSFEQQSWFGSKPILEHDSRATDNLSSLVLNYRKSNLTYPPNTYKDLVFPALQLNESGWDNDVSIQIKIPAAKLMPKCIRLAEEEYKATVSGSDVSITQLHPCPGYGLVDVLGLGYYGNGYDNRQIAFVAASFPSPSNPIINNSVCPFGSEYPDLVYDPGGNVGYIYDMFVPWRLQTYAWGKASSDGMSFEHLSLWQCNYSWFEVFTETRLVLADTGKLMIDHNNPPVQLHDDLKPWWQPFAVPDLDDEIDHNAGGNGTYGNPVFPNLPGPPKPDLEEVGLIFSSILEPAGPIKLEYLGDENREAEILKELHANFALAAAQVANIENRLNGNETSTMPPKHHGDLARIEAIISVGTHWRLVQNPVPTFIIVGILSLIVLANLWAIISDYLRRSIGIRHRWLLDMDPKGLTPDGFGSIELMSALLYGSNASASLTSDARQLESKRFRMGWFQAGSEGEKVYTIGEIHDENFKFLETKDAAKDNSRPFDESVGW